MSRTWLTVSASTGTFSLTIKNKYGAAGGSGATAGSVVSGGGAARGAAAAGTGAAATLLFGWAVRGDAPSDAESAAARVTSRIIGLRAPSSKKTKYAAQDKS